MITEDYVSYKVARMLQEKGFDEVCFACYEYFISGVTLYQGWQFEYKGESVRNTDEIVKCPTLQMAMKWLREIHKLFIEISVNFIYPVKYCYYSAVYDKDMNIKKRPAKNQYDTYEEAAMDAIKYCLTRLI